MQPLKGTTLYLDALDRACFSLDALHHQFPGGRHHVQAHHQPLGRGLAHHGVKQPPLISGDSFRVQLPRPSHLKLLRAHILDNPKQTLAYMKKE
ncbi:MAG: hypothetical protein IAE77_16360 [Prosthecobacter sp.]|uniref:hypothetical protein n=1 Tax=Prosthecobacter sp. TaxID=1965333 RepID=UPI001A078952|nr:hypothetical protein [Prosthecobacter sp.]MBE2285036.1 hypothetical protein [Prosthecobacter sp.]